MTLTVVGWLIDAGTEYEHAIVGAWTPSRGGMTAEPLVLRVDAEAEIERLRAEVDSWSRQASDRAQDALDLVAVERERLVKLCRAMAANFRRNGEEVGADYADACAQAMQGRWDA